MNISLLTIILTLTTLSFPISTQSSCGSSNPQTISDCTNSNTPKIFCCFLTPLSVTGTGTGTSNNNICQQINVGSSILQNQMINGINYNVNCGINDSTDQCLAQNTHNITSKYYCTNFSTEGNSCCMTTINGINRCQWLNMKYDGETTVGAITYKCAASILKYSLALLLIILIYI